MMVASDQYVPPIDSFHTTINIILNNKSSFCVRMKMKNMIKKINECGPLSALWNLLNPQHGIVMSSKKKKKNYALKFSIKIDDYGEIEEIAQDG